MSVFKDIYDISKDVVQRIDIIEKNDNLEYLNSEYQKIIWDLVNENKELRRDVFELESRYKPLTAEEYKLMNIPMDENMINMLTILEVDVRSSLREVLEKELQQTLVRSFKQNKGKK